MRIGPLLQQSRMSPDALVAACNELAAIPREVVDAVTHAPALYLPRQNHSTTIAPTAAVT